MYTVFYTNSVHCRYSYADGEDASLLRVVENHRKSVRCLKMSEEGCHMFSGSKDKSWCQVDLETGKLLHKQAKAHELVTRSLVCESELVH